MGSFSVETNLWYYLLKSCVCVGVWRQAVPLCLKYSKIRCLETVRNINLQGWGILGLTEICQWPTSRGHLENLRIAWRTATSASTSLQILDNTVHLVTSPIIKLFNREVPIALRMLPKKSCTSTKHIQSLYQTSCWQTVVLCLLANCWHHFLGHRDKWQVICRPI